MKNFRVKVWPVWTAHKDGELFLGMRLQFATNIYDWTSGMTKTQISFSFGFIFVTLHVSFSKWMR